MAVYKIFPSQDSTLYSHYPVMNTGLDAINEIFSSLDISENPSISRFLIKFNHNEITDILDNKIQNSSWDAFLNCFIATANGISSNYILETWPVAQDWENGTGEYLDSPQTTDGVSWKYSQFSGSSPWSAGGIIGTELYTSSFNPLYVSQGGGNWFYSGSGVSSYGVTQSLGLRDLKDLQLNVTTIVSKWYNNSIPNYGFITKWEDQIEFNTSSFVQPILKYYSVDTNTIYPPHLEFRWEDYSTVLTGSLSGSIVTTSNIKLSLSENPGTFNPESENRFRINVSPLYPTRVFQTSSLFTNQYFLPEDSYYAIKDLDTNEFIINFDTTYTKISSDVKGNYFDVYMSGLEPERYYKILIKTIIDGSVKIFDDNYYFKVING
jgi:hypothetical protein